MFRRLSDGLPTEPATQAELQQTLNEVSDDLYSSPPSGHSAAAPAEQAARQGTIVQAETPATGGQAGTTDLLPYFVSDDERFNQLNNEAIRKCTREVVLAKLRGLRINELFLSGPSGTTISTTRPEGPHVSILTTCDLPELKLRRDIIIVIGEHTLDLGIWSWRIVLHNKGLEDGSAVGLLRDLARFRITGPEASMSFRNAADINTPNSDPPGVIILNPGQLVYSHKLHINMSIESWLARPKQHALSQQFVIDDTHNRIPNHGSPAEHLATVFDHILPQLLGPTASLFVAGIADGADDFAAYMNARLQEAQPPLPPLPFPPATPTTRVLAFAALQPTISISEIRGTRAKTWLRGAARSWVASPRPRGTLVDLPCASPASLGADEAEAEESGVLAPTFAAGVRVRLDAIFPSALPEVLAFFRERADAAAVEGL